MLKLNRKLLNSLVTILQCTRTQGFTHSAGVQKTHEIKKLLTLVNSNKPPKSNIDDQQDLSKNRVNLEKGEIESDVTLITSDAIKRAQKYSDSNYVTKPKPEWLIQKESLKNKFEQWNPTKKLSRDEMENVRLLKQNMPHLTNTDIGHHFKVSPEAVRRILKSNFNPRTERERKDLEDRWVKRGERIKDLMDNENPRQSLPAGLGNYRNKIQLASNSNIDRASKKLRNSQQSKKLNNLKNIKI